MEEKGLDYNKRIKNKGMKNKGIDGKRVKDKEMKQMRLNYIHSFDISQICESGQCFRMKQEREGGYSVIAGNRYLEITKNDVDQDGAGDEIQKGNNGTQYVFHCSEWEFEDFWKHYFDLETDYDGYRERISPRDIYLNHAAEFGYGIRILNQDLWEMIVSFLISQQNNIVRIRRCIQNISEKYGERRENASGGIYYAFPTVESLAYLPEDELKDCNLGYRSKYVVRTARSIVSGEVSLEAIKTMPYRKAKEELLKLFGVGEKVADCICLFALHHMEAFPVDTHINQALKAHYPKGFPKKRYKGCEGVMQQYIFYYELLGNKR